METGEQQSFSIDLGQVLNIDREGARWVEIHREELGLNWILDHIARLESRVSPRAKEPSLVADSESSPRKA
jgi:hypothetical protein